MAASIFDFVAEELERRTDLAKLEARGTVRLALKEAGLDARSVSPEQMAEIVREVMPGEMRARGVEGAEEVCEAITGALKSSPVPSGTPETEPPDPAFRLAQR